MDYDVIIIGGGLAGLACANALHTQKCSFLLLEASNRIGGRVRTDRLDGYLIDHGFQVLQSAYPEAQRQLDYSQLDLRAFAPGAMVRLKGRFYTIADPRRRPRYLMTTLTAPIGNFSDRLRMLALARKVTRRPLEHLFEHPEWTTLEFLKRAGFSEAMIQRFFRPFFGGVCLDHRLQASSRVFQYVFRMFAQGDAVLPAQGMEAIPRQLASRLPNGTMRTQARVARVGQQRVVLESGESISAHRVVLATPAPETNRLLHAAGPVASFGEYCHYFSMDHPPVSDAFLILNGDGDGPINNIAFPSLVSSNYAPAGKTLASVVTLKQSGSAPSAGLKPVCAQLTAWFGPQAANWRHLKTVTIEHALAGQEPPTRSPFRRPAAPLPWMEICGEYRSLPGIQWALMSGRRAAEAVLAQRSSFNDR